MRDGDKSAICLSGLGHHESKKRGKRAERMNWPTVCPHSEMSNDPSFLFNSELNFFIFKHSWFKKTSIQRIRKYMSLVPKQMSLVRKVLTLVRKEMPVFPNSYPNNFSEKVQQLSLFSGVSLRIVIRHRKRKRNQNKPSKKNCFQSKTGLKRTAQRNGVVRRRDAATPSQIADKGIGGASQIESL